MTTPTPPTPAPASRSKRQTQLITRAMIRQLRERIAANPPRWMRAKSLIVAADGTPCAKDTDFSGTDSESEQVAE